MHNDSVDQLWVVYSTETGNSYELAIQTCLALQNRISGIAQLTQDFEWKNNSLYIIFASTTGQGDPPYTCRPFWRKMMAKSYGIPHNVQFCIYGLGDRGYGDNFNITARKIRQRLLMLGATQIVDIVLGDQQDANGCFHQYFSVFLPAILKFTQKIQIKQLTKIDFLSVEQKIENKKASLNNSMDIKIIDRKMLSSCQGKDVYWITCQIAESIQYERHRIEIGDVLQIYPQNNEKVVDQMMKYFEENRLNDINLSQARLRKYLRETANLQNIVNFTFFFNDGAADSQLGNMISEDTDAQIKDLFQGKLNQLGRDYEQYFNYIKRFRRNVRQVIRDFNLKIPVSQFIKKLGHIIARKYSVAQIYPKQRYKFSLLIKQEKYRISSSREVVGLCSFDLCHSLIQQNQDKTKINLIRKGRILKNGQFSIDYQLIRDNKILMISLGTGIAPFLCIMGQALNKQSNVQLVLFHSSRYIKDVPMKIQIIDKLEINKKLAYFPTFTRQPKQQSEIQTRRIQFIIRQQKQLIENYKNGKIMICGSKEIYEIIKRIFQEEFGLDVKALRKKGVICVENW